MSRVDKESPEVVADVFATRRSKLKHLRSQGWAYPNDFRPTHVCQQLPDLYKADKDSSDASDSSAGSDRAGPAVEVAGRLMAKRVMGSAVFFQLRDGSGEIQLYISKKLILEPSFDEIKSLDVGDIAGVNGELFVTRTGELSVRCARLRLLVKNLHPLPEKFHGLSDINLRYRRRYLDLLASRSVRDVFAMRSRTIGVIRHYLHENKFLEVETPMLQPRPGGAAAKPFATHHNALKMDLFLRVSPELYLKRLLVGGFDKIYELNRNFRNEGLSTRHNPEFTMLEFYEAYQDFHGMMRHTHAMFRQIAEELDCDQILCGTDPVSVHDEFEQVSVEELIRRHHPQLSADSLRDGAELKKYCEKILPGAARDLEANDAGGWLMLLFDRTVEDKLIRPTFVTHHPSSVSALARPNDKDPFVCDRFELVINGQEICNGFSENNDPERQRQVFTEQLDNHALAQELSLSMDEDFLTALDVGMPPAAGQGIGIDRLVMAFSRSASIRDVIFFPLTRQEPGA